MGRPRGRPRKTPPLPKPIETTEIVENTEDDQAEIELLDFLDSLGPEGLTEVSLYRILPTGKHTFVSSGHPSVFSEQYIQITHGEGDYLVRAKLHGKWYRSKTLSVEGLAQTKLDKSEMDEMDRLKLDLEQQRLRIEQQHSQMEAERREREQRNHEFQLKLLDHQRSGSEAASISELIRGAASLKDLSGGDWTEKIAPALAAFNGLLESFARLKEFRGSSDGTNGGGSFWSEFTPVLVDVARQVVPQFVNRAMTQQTDQSAINSPLLVSGNGSTPPAAPITNNNPANDGPGNPTVSVSETKKQQPSSDEKSTAGDYEQYKRGALQFALDTARRGRDPVLYAHLSLDMMDNGDSTGDITQQMLRELIAAKTFEGWFAGLENMEPLIVGVKPWFREFYDAIMAEFQDSDKAGGEAK